MKKLITVFSALVLVGCIAMVFYGCGAKEEETTTTIPTTQTRTERTTNSGMVTDKSEPDKNGVIGDIVTDVSEGMSEIMTDVSDDVSRMMD